MPKKDCILNLPGFSIQKVIPGDPMVLEVNYRRKAQCPYCQRRKLRTKDSFTREVRHESFGHRRTLLRFKAHKFYCASCCRYFNQRFPGISKHQRATERLHQQVFYHHTKGISQKDLSQDLRLGKATIERGYHKGFWLKHQLLQNRHCPMVLGIDEHSFSKKQGYATTFCDLAKHKIFDVVKGRSAQDLKDYLLQLKGRERVKVVCIDLSSSYRQLIKRYFPNANIVADRFHVIRQLLQTCLQTYQTIDPTMKYQRGLLAALRAHSDNLTLKRLHTRDTYLKQYPAIKAIYYFKQQLYQLLMKKMLTAKRAKRYIPLFLAMIEKLKQSPFKHLKTLGKTFYQWREEIVRMWRFTKSNGITEGVHRKMKLIQRRAYGFKNFENYRLRVKVLCS